MRIGLTRRAAPFPRGFASGAGPDSRSGSKAEVRPRPSAQRRLRMSQRRGLGAELRRWDLTGADMSRAGAGTPSHTRVGVIGPTWGKPTGIGRPLPTTWRWRIPP